MSLFSEIELEELLSSQVLMGGVLMDSLIINSDGE
jgi:hypothetical protein